MDSNNDFYKVKLTNECIEEINQIYYYIANKLEADNSAIKLIQRVRKQILYLSNMPKRYPETSEMNRVKKTYRKMVMANYIVLYTIDEDKKIVYVSHMYYSGSNYLNKI